MQDTAYPLGRLDSIDERDKAFPMKRARMAAPPTPWLYPYRHHITGPILSQLDPRPTNSCVGQAWKQFLMTTPIRTLAGPTALDIYTWATENDEFQGSYPQVDQGTSIRAGVECLRQQGRIANYVWAEDIEDVRRWILDTGPVVAGIPWFTGMDRPDAEGFVRVDGSIRGGHAIEISGYSAMRKAFRFVNSWRRSWGQHGRAWLRYNDLAALMKMDGECCAAIEQAL